MPIRRAGWVAFYSYIGVKQGQGNIFGLAAGDFAPHNMTKCQDANVAQNAGPNIQSNLRLCETDNARQVFGRD